jgi:hypothetical protein
MSNSVMIPEHLKDLLDKRLEDQKQHENSGAKIVYISTKGRRFRVGDEKMPDSFDVVVGLAAFEKTWYNQAYDPALKATPACYALSLSEPVGPHANSQSPQNKTCEGCPHNEYGSALVGKGKACKDARRLLMFARNAQGNVDFSQIAQLKVAATSIRAWSSYCSMVRQRYGLPYSWVVTNVSFVDDSDYPQLKFECKGPVENRDEILEVEARLDELKKAAVRPFKVDDEEEGEGKAAAPKTRSKMG